MRFRFPRKRRSRRLGWTAMSASRPIATGLTRRNELTRRAKSGSMHRSNESLYSNRHRRVRAIRALITSFEGDCGSPFRGMDSAQRPELSFLRFAQRRLIRPPRAGVISPSDQRQDGKRNRKGERNHEPSYHDVWAMENCISAHKY
jgi:hypothetical protein